ncbi:nucleotidyltransferase domain-containing protein [Paenibacillus sp. NPDC058174]|uniref:nucleotidyltransferase domain-containing protein n=1 Tax=Paenibacillus sp. NPDC058174 TaxID=3346366 RepID=UPI0036DE0A8D
MTKDYTRLIQNELARIEGEEGVRIVYACESGSRAWGFPSRDSDYDVRFIYIRPVEWYLSITEKRDVIERPISDMLDITGWDLRKALRLFRKSNPPLLEWLQSPAVYQETGSATEALRSLSPLTFSPRSCLYHYLNMARGNYRDYLQGDRVRLKKYFYVLRPILACEWIEKRNEMPPIAFEELMRELLPPDSEVGMEVSGLLERKRAGEELDSGLPLQAINDYLEERIRYFGQTASDMPAVQEETEQQLDILFRQLLTEAWQPD